MATQLITAVSARPFPTTELRRRLEVELQEIADQASTLRSDWEPLLDSLRVVGTVLAIEDLFPSQKIPPDKVVRKGGYNSVAEAIDDMVTRIKRLVERP